VQLAGLPLPTTPAAPAADAIPKKMQKPDAPAISLYTFMCAS